MPSTTPAIQALLAPFSFAGSAVGVGDLVGSEVCDARVVPVEAGLAVVGVGDESVDDSEDEMSVEEELVMDMSSSKVPSGFSR